MQRRSPIFFALFILGVVLLFAGIIYGLGSRHVQYKSVPQGSIAHYLSADGTGYLQMEGNPTLYIVHQDNFSPKLSTFADSDTVSFVYDPGETTTVDVKSTIGTHLVGSAAKVVAITAIDTAGQKTYTTPEYTSNSQGYDHNQWPLGIGLLVVGLLMIGSSFFLPRKEHVKAMSPRFSDSPMQERPLQQTPYQQNTPPYGQPLQQVYPPTLRNFQPQSGPFQQPSSPNYPQQPSTPFGQTQQQQLSAPLRVPQQQPNPFGPPQQPDPQGQPPPPQPPQQFGTLGQFMKQKPFQPPQQ